MNPTIDLINARTSTRVFADELITAEERAAILDSALRAPTAGNMMLYSIIEIADQALKDELAITCDDQPFIAKAPLVLMFFADYQRWLDLFEASDVGALKGIEHRMAPGLGDLMLACSDALIAAQNSVIAAESLGLGSCYIGDIMENAERHIEMLDLPPRVFPIAMVCFGRSARERPPTPHYERHMVQTDRYRRLSAEELAEVSRDLQEMHAPHGLKPGLTSYPQDVYARKYTSGFMAEMNRSVALLAKRWQYGDS